MDLGWVDGVPKVSRVEELPYGAHVDGIRATALTPHTVSGDGTAAASGQRCSRAVDSIATRMKDHDQEERALFSDLSVT